MKKKSFKQALIEAELKAQVDEFNGVPEKTYPKFIKKLSYAIAAIIAVLGVPMAFVNILFGLVFFAPAGIIFLTAKSMKTRDDVLKPNAEPSSGGLIVEEYYAAGVEYYKDNIDKLAIRNDLWRKHNKTLVEMGKADTRIYRYNYVRKPVKLIPEPNNEYDKNALIVQIAGEKVGYISARDALHVKAVLADREIKYISSFIGGGYYKIPREEGEMFKGEDPHRVKVKIAYKA